MDTPILKLMIILSWFYVYGITYIKWYHPKLINRQSCMIVQSREMKLKHLI